MGVLRSYSPHAATGISILCFCLWKRGLMWRRYNDGQWARTPPPYAACSNGHLNMLYGCWWKREAI